MNMKISINSKVFFKVLSDMKNIEHKSIDTQWSQDSAMSDEKNEEWDELMMSFGFKTPSIWINVIPEIEGLVLSLKEQYNLSKEIVLTPFFWIDYLPKVENHRDELSLRLWFYFDEVLNKAFINSLDQKEKNEFEENIDRLQDEFWCKLYFTGNSDIYPENMRRLINLLYFQRNNMTVYEYLLEEPILDSEVNHEESVKRTTARLKRLHRQTLDYFRNLNSVFVNFFLDE